MHQNYILFFFFFCATTLISSLGFLNNDLPFKAILDLNYIVLANLNLHLEGIELIVVLQNISCTVINL
jgi:hypothetical protein